jgi:hypothetical protein
MEINYSVFMVELYDAINKSPTMADNLKMSVYDYAQPYNKWDVTMWRYMANTLLHYGELNKLNSLMRDILEHEIYSRTVKTPETTKTPKFVNLSQIEKMSKPKLCEKVENDYKIAYLIHCLFDNSDDKLPEIIINPYNNKDVMVKEVLKTYDLYRRQKLSRQLRRLFITTLKQTTSQYIDYVVAMVSLQLPVYVMLWILEWIVPTIDSYKSAKIEKNQFHILSEVKRIRINENILKFARIKNTV